MSYTPLHVHSAIGSIRDSILRLEGYVAKAKELNMTSIGLSDHGNAGALLKFYKVCKKANIKPVMGQEFYYVPDVAFHDATYHLCLYAKNNIGLKNLFHLSTIANTQGFFRKPRIDKQMLYDFREGIIVTQACCFSHVGQLLIQERTTEAIIEIEWFKASFGDDYYLEVHDHSLDKEDPPIMDEVIVREFYRDYGKKHNIKIIAATDSHFLNKEDKYIHNIFKQLAYGSTGKGKDDGFAGTGYHIWSLEEMQEKFTQEEIDNTSKLADKCYIHIEHNEYHFPVFQLPDGYPDSYAFLRFKCFEGLKRLGVENDERYVKQLEFELNILHLAHLEDYFLIVMDYVAWCQDNDILTAPGRGSAAGALVCYALDITKVDPIKYNLIFSRMLNKGRLLQYDFSY